MRALLPGVAKVAFAEKLTEMKITSKIVLPMLALITIHSSPLRAQNAAPPDVPAATAAAPIDESAAIKAAANEGVEFAECFEKMTPAQRKIELDKMLADMERTRTSSCAKRLIAPASPKKRIGNFI